jgi:hypothetical protein
VRSLDEADPAPELLAQERRASAAAVARRKSSSRRSAGCMWMRRDSAAAAGSSRRTHRVRGRCWGWPIGGCPDSCLLGVSTF